MICYFWLSLWDEQSKRISTLSLSFSSTPGQSWSLLKAPLAPLAVPPQYMRHGPHTHTPSPWSSQPVHAAWVPRSH